jgi:phenylalanyl-tRNA synthetase beta chain
MNSLVSYNWLSEYVDLAKIAPDEFAKRMSLSGPAVEKIMPRDAGLEKVVVGRIKAIKPHPNADKLRLVTVDTGARDLDLVCGGSNLEDGQWVAVAEVGAKVRWHGEGEPIEMKPAEIRGIRSEGMICAANEIGLFDAFPHADREILDLGKAIPSLKVKPGTPLANALGLTGDVVMDIEVTSNRIDAMGMVGMAREASAILGRKMVWKEPSLKVTSHGVNESTSKNHKQQTTNNKPVSVTVHDKKLCPRYMAVRVMGVTNGESPWWMKSRLISAGLRPISALVDITNYVLLECAQPMHVFDAKKMAAGPKVAEIHVRLARKGEKMKALDGKTYDLDDKTLVIADAEKPVAVAGVMGGEDTGADAGTTDVIFECATFDPVSVRRTARRLNLYSDAQLRFEKGLSTESVPPAMARAIELTLELCGGEVAGEPADVRAGAYKPLAFAISSDEVEARIGVEIPMAKQAKILKDLGFGVKTKGKTMTATVPWWRDHDIEAPVDLTEEIARVYGYGNVPPRLPVGGLPPRAPDVKLAREDRIKTILEGAGLTEAYSYSFVSEDLYRKADFDASVCLKIQNPLSEEFAYMRTSLLPSIINVVAENAEREKSQRVFEIANVYVNKGQGTGVKGQGWKNLPDEQPMLACAVMEGDESWKAAKGIIEHLFEKLGIQGVRWARISEQGFWHAGRSVQAYVGETLLATVGEVDPRIRSNFKIEGRLAIAECPLNAVYAHAREANAYAPPSPFPESKRDLAIIVPATTEYGAVARTIREIDPLVADVAWFDTYAGKGVPEGKKSLAIHLVFSSRERTLTTDEVDALMENIKLALGEAFGAEVR